jgi:hypothetical protein
MPFFVPFVLVVLRHLGLADARRERIVLRLTALAAALLLLALFPYPDFATVVASYRIDYFWVVGINRFVLIMFWHGITSKRKKRPKGAVCR